MSNEKTRDIAIDFVKVIAILGVIVIHTASRTLTHYSIGTFRWLCGLFWGTLFRASVPLFLMASGAIMLNSQKEISLKKLYLHNILRIVIAMLVWGFAYKIYHLYMMSSLNAPRIIYSIKRLLLFDQEFHFYYMHMILIVYAFLPVTRFFVAKAEKRLVEYALGLWLAFAVVFPALRNFWPFNLLAGMTDQWIVNMTYASIGYGILGFYLKKYPISLKMSIGFFWAGFAAIFLGTYAMSLKTGVLNEVFLYGMSPGVCLLATGIFTLASGIPLKGFGRSAIVYISRASFCTYLSHMFVLYIFELNSITALSMPAIVSVPLIGVSVLAICLALYFVISKIPVLNKWII